MDGQQFYEAYCIDLEAQNFKNDEALSTEVSETTNPQSKYEEKGRNATNVLHTACL